MATLSVRSIVLECLEKSAPLSLREDIFGVYSNDNPQNRSLKSQLDLIQSKPFVRLALVTITDTLGTGGTVITGPRGSLQRDLDNASQVYQGECAAWVYCVGSITVDDPDLVDPDQDDCTMNGHSVSDWEDDLFKLGRNMGANVVCYYTNDDPGGWIGCAAHPPSRRGFWVGDGASPWTFAHELTHVIGDNTHVSDTDNLMVENSTWNITNAPPDLTQDQCNSILSDPDMESCS